VQNDWTHPELEEWRATLARHVALCEAPPILVAHSLGCALVAHWVKAVGHGIKAAFLVAPSDVDASDRTPAAVRGFSPMPLLRFPFPSIVVASSDDPRVSLERAAYFAKCWGSRFIAITNAGHLNDASGVGEWQEGRRLLEELRQS
jgi:predicted alpha/beta hydrolase family esterase